MSRHVAAARLIDLGPLHYGRRKAQPLPQAVREFYNRADQRLYFPVVRFTQAKIDLVAAGLADAVSEHTYTCYACAVLSDHAHLVIRKHKHRAEEMMEHLQNATRLGLIASGTVPPDHPVWTLGGWKRFLSSATALRSAIRYVASNPLTAGLPPQRWPFVKPYDGWPQRRSR